MKEQLSITVLSLWARVHMLYKQFKANDTWKYGTLLAIVAIMTVLLLFREPPSKKDTLGFDPFQLLGVDKNASKRDVQKAFRELSRKFHPDVYKAPDAQDNYLRMQQARDILADEKKRENLEKYGNPDGPGFSLFEVESYPDWIRYPGKKFVAFYLMLATAILVVPLGVVFLSPLLKEPPMWIVNPIFDRIEEAEHLLAGNRDEEALRKLDAVQTHWQSLCARFGKYRKSNYAVIFDSRIAARRALARVYEPNIPSAIHLLSELRKEHKGRLQSAAVASQTRMAFADLRQAFAQASLSKAVKKEVDELLAQFAK